jgi:hypothetical protein
MSLDKLTIWLVFCSFLTSCNPLGSGKSIIIRNDLDFDRNEVVSLKLYDLTDNPTQEKNWKVTSGDEVMMTQIVDTNYDSIPDELLIYVGIKAKEEKKINVQRSGEAQSTDSEVAAYSRFVPERTDDYAWENDLVAFRTYGPEAQRLVEEGKSGGTLSSGLDCWLKRVSYPIINKWYKKYVDGGTYHHDDGEGYDPFHVGKSRGCGGIGVWKNDSLYVSKNFIAYKKIASGPVRNIFELKYPSWMADGILVHETKRITIDLGNQLYKVEEFFHMDGPVPNFAIGLTLHEKKGITFADSTRGLYSYWEPLDDSEIGTAVVIDPAAVILHLDFRTPKKDLSHLYVFTKPAEHVSYYTGFAWKKAGIITNADSWKQYLDHFSQRLKSPLVATQE